MHPLVPRWYAALVLVVLTLGTVSGTVMAFVESGSLRVLGAALAWSSGCLVVAALSALTPAARRLGLGRVRTSPDGSWVVRSPATTVVPLLGAWAGSFVAAGAAVLVFVDHWPRVWEAVDRPGNLALVAVGGGDLRAGGGDDAVAAGITINALAVAAAGQVTRLGEPLAETYRREVIGGPGSFVVTAEDRRDIARALRAKLVREIA